MKREYHENFLRVSSSSSSFDWNLFLQSQGLQQQQPFFLENPSFFFFFFFYWHKVLLSRAFRALCVSWHFGRFCVDRQVHHHLSIHPSHTDVQKRYRFLRILVVSSSSSSTSVCVVSAAALFCLLFFFSFADETRQSR